MPNAKKLNWKGRHGVAENQYAGRLCGRLCYLLRYGALKEGLVIQEGGFVDIKDLMSVNMMRHHSEDEVLNEINTSLSHRNTKRFQCKHENGRILVRSSFCRSFEPNRCHEGTRVNTLLQCCISYVTENLQDYDLDDFPDEHIINLMISHLKYKKKLNSQNLQQLLVPVIEHLDFSNVYLTQGIIRTMLKKCPYLRVINFTDCGYIITDNVIETILRKLPGLESVNFASCKHITDHGILSIREHGKNILELNLSCIKGISDCALLDLIVSCERLKYLDIYDHTVSGEVRTVMIEAARQRGIKIVLKGLYESDPDVTIENPSMLLPNFGRIW